MKNISREFNNTERQRWWDSYDVAKQNLDDHGAMICGEHKDKIRKWVSHVKTQKKDGHLDIDQVNALKAINFSFSTDRKNMVNNAGKGKKVERAFELHIKFNNSEPDPPTPEFTEYCRLMRELKKAYRDGNLSEKAARKRGIS